MARNFLPSSTLSAVSTFQNQRNTAPVTAPPQAERNKEAIYPDCKTTFKIFTEGARGWNNQPHQVCIHCYRSRRRRQHKKRSPQVPSPSIQALEADPISQVAAFQTSGAGSHHKRRRRRRNSSRTTHGTINKPLPPSLNHHIFSKGEWKRACLREHPRVAITISLDKSTQDNSGNSHQSPDIHADVSAIADTGAQSDLWSFADFLASGLTRADLHPIHLSLSAANRSPILIEGAFFAKLATRSPTGEESSCRSMVYVSSSFQDMYLSYESLLNLSLLSSDFPSTDHGASPCGRCHQGQHDESRRLPTTNATRSLNDGCSIPPPQYGTTYSCPQRQAPPPRPSELPFPSTPENTEWMKAWLLNRYASSTFNTCPHRPLPCMEGPPVEIHVDHAATPKACDTPTNIPLHWQQRVYKDLLRDEALGVIERVPYGEPVTWCHRMVITRKHDGSPRRTVDLSPLNKFCQRETFAMESPFHLARRIPKNTWKTVTDAWNGYHSVPLRESDRHLTTFITPFCRWRYIRARQGFLSSGDGCNRRFDAVLAEYERNERCVDDTVHYDSDLEQQWWRTIDFLTRVGQAGIVLIPDKFQFAKRTVDFAGFRVSDRVIEPLPKYLDAIRDFPSPTNTTDIRSWFRLVN